MTSVEERQHILDDVEAYCEELRPIEELCYLEHRYNDQAVSLAQKHKILGIHVPTQYGGRGADLKTYMEALVRIGREGTGARTLFSGHSSIGQKPIMDWGTPDQKKKYLTASSQGEKILAFGLTEPDAGSNPRQMQMSYRYENGQYLLNGVKYLISNGGLADAIVTFAYPENGGDRISAFIVDTDGEGIEREVMTAKLGLPTCDTAMFELTNFSVPKENLLGDEGQGFHIAMKALVSGRLSVAAGCLGVIQDCLIEACDYARQRSQHGKKIAHHQLVQELVARIEIGRQTSESVLRTAVEAQMASDSDPQDLELYRRTDRLAAQAKYVASHAALEAADCAIQVFGGRGYSELFRPGRHWKDVRVCRIYEGTDEILKLKIAASVLGKEYEAYH